MVAYPAWLGRWPAAIGIFAFAFVELAYRNRDDPTQLAIMALVYAVAMLAGMAWFGIETWSERGRPVRRLLRAVRAAVAVHAP